MTRTGLDRLLAGGGPDLSGSALGLISHPAAVTRDLVPAADALIEAGFDLRALFGPQHGALGDKQDNMIESDHFTDARTGLPVHSLYSETRKPTPDMLDGLDAVLFDLQDVGVKVYTFVWTMALAMEACGEAGVRFVVLDRPNPIGGTIREGPVLKPGLESFVGLHPLPLRHGLTLGEVALWLRGARGIDCELEVVPCAGWRRDAWWDETGLPWVLPSPNLPTLNSCTVYPGMVLVEGTNLSEGRGTTRPFELFGAPYVDPHRLSAALNALELPGARFRPCSFEPTFQKHAGILCGGAQIHVTDRLSLRSVEAAVAVFVELRRQAPDEFAWIPPPYEYEPEKMPIDILWGGDGLRLGVDGGATVSEILSGADADVAAFEAEARSYLLYE
jgi:uncharacterized protein YbbC (DUF1343 family)